MRPFKNRRLYRNDRVVEVYRNVSMPDGVWYSIRQRGVVIGHARCVELLDATFLVMPSGRARALKQKRKNVHAWIRGELISSDKPDGAAYDTRVSYRLDGPDKFVDESGGVVRNARLVTIGQKGVVAWRINDW